MENLWKRFWYKRIEDEDICYGMRSYARYKFRKQRLINILFAICLVLIILIFKGWELMTYNGLGMV